MVSSQRSVVTYSHSTSKILTPDGWTQLQRLFLVLPASHLRYVLTTCIPDLEETLDGLAIDGTEQV